ncbi:probable phosphatase phospho1 isoform X1 [Ictalurus furcatus]|uniref:probable phosphatase phospho1 isoform X1 n=2 Tax=Ictalurus furcatus TaxID=66913 RepID=UPI0023501614|nr:probable phosphatase phospho1 isoform X1 [Ictalurus furcatus]
MTSGDALSRPSLTSSACPVRPLLALSPVRQRCPGARATQQKAARPSTEKKTIKMAARFLFFFDFDETLIAENSDDSVVRATPLKKLPASLSDSCRPGFFFKHSQRILTFLSECGVTEDAIRAEIEQIPTSPGGAALLDFLLARDDFECVVVSDANSYFIETWLQHLGARKLFAKVFTNPAEFDINGRLVLRPFHSHTCAKCPENMCKQVVLRDYMSERVTERGEPFQKVFYIGDGENDVCPTLALGQHDTVFPRRGFPMHRIIQDLCKTQPGVYKPSLMPWEQGEDVVDFLKEILQEK